MEKEFVIYEQAVALKELGFDERCIGRYCIVTEWEEPTGEILLQFIDCELSEKILVKAPLKQQVFRWFREKYELGHTIHPYNLHAYITDLQNVNYYPDVYDVNLSESSTYDEAEDACIDKLIEIAKQQDNE
jgi:hypothetical protein